jgi:hypothetical protein
MTRQNFGMLALVGLLAVLELAAVLLLAQRCNCFQDSFLHRRLASGNALDPGNKSLLLRLGVLGGLMCLFFMLGLVCPPPSTTSGRKISSRTAG